MLRQDLAELLTVDPRYASLSARARRRILQQAYLLGLIEDRGGLLYPSAMGAELLEDDGFSVLIEQILRCVFGAAHLLQHLDLKEDSPTTQWASQSLRGASWDLQTLAQWMVSLGLVERPAPGKTLVMDALVLSEDGQQWASRLPETLPLLPETAWTSTQNQSAPVEVGPHEPWPTLDNMTQAMAEDAEASHLVFKPSQLRALHLAWHCQPSKRFVILSGLSGTGKTALALTYARLYCQAMGLDPEAHREVVAVSPDWRDPSGLLGYFSALHEEPTFLAEPALRLLLRAAQDPGRPFFLILDEMNLARVERYLAPLLSAMETGQAITLHTAGEDVSGVPPSISWPENLFVAGTVNMDESTHAFSDKVLDRAFTLEFWEVDLPRYFEARGQARQALTEEVLLSLKETLRPVRRHFGYRSAGEILAFVASALELGADEHEALDQALLSKVLPKLRGEDSQAMRLAMQQAQTLCKTHKLPLCAQKLEQMTQRLMFAGVTRFWS